VVEDNLPPKLVPENEMKNAKRFGTGFGPQDQQQTYKMTKSHPSLGYPSSTFFSCLAWMTKQTKILSLT
jgi:hypothetical protein